MRKTMEKISILSLSLLLITTYAVSAAVPAMQEFYSGYSASQVEQLISIPSFAIMIVIILNTWLEKIFSERFSITAGMLLLAAGGSLPLMVNQYEFVFASRILLGIGIGLVNSHAINMISLRYEGQERATLLGFRSSAEVLGNAILTMAAGLLMAYGWNKSFAVYLFSLPILVMYLCFVPGRWAVTSNRGGKVLREEAAEVSVKRYLGFLIGSFGLGTLTICVNSAITIRIPSVVDQRQLGNEAASSLALSLMMITGILAGIVFGKLTQIFHEKLMMFSTMVLAAGMLLIAVSDNMTVLNVGAMVAGFAYNIIVTELFNDLSANLPGSLMSLGTTCVLAGCNFGSAIAPAVMSIIGVFSSQISAPFWFFAVVMPVVGVGMTLRKKRE